MIEQGAQIGTNCRIHDTAWVSSNVVIGDRCIIGPGCVIGNRAFKLSKRRGKWVPEVVNTSGQVLIGDDVYVGSATVIDSGATIGNGVAIDSLVYIAHHTIIREGTIVYAGCTLLGEVEIGEDCEIGAGATIRNSGPTRRMIIAKGSRVGMGAAVVKPITAARTKVMGVPAR